jgi:hypothetical protein
MPPKSYPLGNCKPPVSTAPPACRPAPPSSIRGSVLPVFAKSIQQKLRPAAPPVYRPQPPVAGNPFPSAPKMPNLAHPMAVMQRSPTAIPAQQYAARLAFPRTIQRSAETISIVAGGTSISAYALRATGIPELYWRFIFPGGTVYRRTGTDPLLVFANGWTRDGYDDLVRHTDTDQGIGSNWIATTKDLTGMDERYGTYAFEISLEWHQGVVVNPAYQELTRHRNPHAEQNEVAVYGRIAGSQVTAVWVPKVPDVAKTTNPGRVGLVWADYYDRYTVQQYISARGARLVTHPP